MSALFDDPSLLEEMMADMQNASILYRPTNYWEHYAKSFLPRLKRGGLANFRRDDGIFGSFGAVDLDFRPRLRLRQAFRGARLINWAAEKLLAISPFTAEFPGIEPQWSTEYFYRRVNRDFDRRGWWLEKAPTSLVGNPEDIFVNHGKPYSRAHLQYCQMLVDAPIPLFNQTTFLELGSGLGRNAEIILGMFPAASIILADIPPQLYVCEQYLKAALPGIVKGYRDTKRMSRIDPSPGYVQIIPPWRLPDVTKANVFWNSASFQEMEPAIVENYLSNVKHIRPEWIYINARPEGNHWGEWKPGRGGTKDRVTEKHYVYALSEYELMECYTTDYFLRGGDYKSWIFKRS